MSNVHYFFTIFVKIDGMKKLIFVIIFVTISFFLFPQTQNNWKTVSIPNICTFTIPPKMELRDKNSFDEKLFNNLMEPYYNIKPNINRVVIQPRGFKSNDYLATELYSRIIVEFEEGDFSDFNISEFTKSDLAEITLFYKEVIQTEADEFNISIKKISNTILKKIGNNQALYYSYTRGAAIADKSDVFVAVYNLFLGNKTVKVTVSFRESEAGIWRNDFEKSIQSFSFN